MPAPAGSFFTNADGSTSLYQYNDVPAAFNANVNIGENSYTAPSFAGGNQPTLTAAGIDGVISCAR